MAHSAVPGEEAEEVRGERLAVAALLGVGGVGGGVVQEVLRDVGQAPVAAAARWLLPQGPMPMSSPSPDAEHTSRMRQAGLAW